MSDTATVPDAAQTMPVPTGNEPTDVADLAYLLGVGPPAAEPTPAEGGQPAPTEPVVESAAELAPAVPESVEPEPTVAPTVEPEPVKAGVPEDLAREIADLRTALEARAPEEPAEKPKVEPAAIAELPSKNFFSRETASDLYNILGDAGVDSINKALVAARQDGYTAAMEAVHGVREEIQQGIPGQVGNSLRYQRDMQMVADTFRHKYATLFGDASEAPEILQKRTEVIRAYVNNLIVKNPGAENTPEGFAKVLEQAGQELMPIIGQRDGRPGGPANTRVGGRTVVGSFASQRGGAPPPPQAEPSAEAKAVGELFDQMRR